MKNIYHLIFILCFLFGAYIFLHIFSARINTDLIPVSRLVITDNGDVVETVQYKK